MSIDDKELIFLLMMRADPMEPRKDIFDKIMSLRLLRPLWPFYHRFKEILLYLFFGGLTTVLSIALFWLFTGPCGMSALLGNAVDWIICVLFAYVTNRTWVFEEKAYGRKGILREAVSFIGGRLGTLAMEELVLFIGIDLLGMNSMLVKVVAQVLVVIGNYLISKFIVFKVSE